MNFKCQSSVYVCESGGNKAKSNWQKKPNTFLLCPCVPPREPAEEELVWQRGHLSSLFTRRTQSESMPLGFPAPRSLTLICLIVLTYSAGQERCHTVMAPYITPPPTKRPGVREQGNSVWVIVTLCSWKMQYIVEKWRQIHYMLKSKTSCSSQLCDARCCPWTPFSFSHLFFGRLVFALSL